jgi:hypothetical protein
VAVKSFIVQAPGIVLSAKVFSCPAATYLAHLLISKKKIFFENDPRRFNHFHFFAQSRGKHFGHQAFHSKNILQNS